MIMARYKKNIKSYLVFHVYDHEDEYSFEIVGKSKFMRWLNKHADNQRYSFFPNHKKLNVYLEKIQEEVDTQDGIANLAEDAYKG